MQAGLIRRSNALTDTDVAFMVKAINRQGEEFARAWAAWGVTFDPLAFYTRKDGLPADRVRIISIVDDVAMAGVIGFHDEWAGTVSAQVQASARTSVTTSHEYLEMKADPFLNLWRTLPDGRRSTAVEVCDAVEDDTYFEEAEIMGERRPIELSNYLLPSWFDPLGKYPYDRLHRLSEPFQMSPGGYIIVRDDGGHVSNVFASGMPPTMLQKLANPVSRTLGRMRGVVL